MENNMSLDLWFDDEINEKPDLNELNYYEFIIFKPIIIPDSVQYIQNNHGIYYNISSLIKYANLKDLILLHYPEKNVSETIKEEFKNIAVDTLLILYNTDFLKEKIMEKLNLNAEDISIYKLTRLIDYKGKVYEALDIKFNRNSINLAEDITLYEDSVNTVKLIQRGKYVYALFDTPLDLTPKHAILNPIFQYRFEKYLIAKDLAYANIASSKYRQTLNEIIFNKFPTETIITKEQFIKLYFELNKDITNDNQGVLKKPFNTILKNPQSYVYIRPVLENELWD